MGNRLVTSLLDLRIIWETRSFNCLETSTLRMISCACLNNLTSLVWVKLLSLILVQHNIVIYDLSTTRFLLCWFCFLFR